MKYIISIIITICMLSLHAQPFTTHGLQCGVHGESGCEQYRSPCTNSSQLEITFWFNRTNWPANSNHAFQIINTADNATVDSQQIPNGAGLVSIQTCIPKNTCLEINLLKNGVIAVPTDGYGIHIQGDTLTAPGLANQTAQHYIGTCCQLNLTANVINSDCYNFFNGQIALDIQGGVAPYQVNWSNGVSFTTTLNGLSSGMYAATVTDAFGCTGTIGNLSIQNPGLLEVSIASTLPTTPNGADGVATASPIGGTPPYSYVWQHGGSSAVAPNLPLGTYNVEVTDNNGCTANQTITLRPLEVALKVFLEGTLDTTSFLMSDQLRQRSLIPAAQPYNQPGFNYPGTETVSSTLLAQGGSKAIVDWVWVQIRDSQAWPFTKLATKAALLLRNGQIVDPTTNSNLVFETLSSGQYHIAVYHRNHMAAMTSTPQLVTDSRLEYDFTQENSYLGPAQIGFGQKQLTAAAWGLYAGDMDQAVDIQISDITGSDRVYWSDENGKFLTYNAADVNLDGDVTGIDRILWSNNNGFSNRIIK